MRTPAVVDASASSLRRQAIAVDALLAVIEWGDSEKAATSRGVVAHTLSNRLYELYQLLDVDDRTNATLTMWPLIRDQVIVRDRAGSVLLGRRQMDRAA